MLIPTVFQLHEYHHGLCLSLLYFIPFKPNFQEGAMLAWSPWWTCDSKGHEFESRPFRFQVTTLGKLFTSVCPFFTKQHNLVPVKRR